MLPSTTVCATERGVITSCVHAEADRNAAGPCHAAYEDAEAPLWSPHKASEAHAGASSTWRPHVRADRPPSRAASPQRPPLADRPVAARPGAAWTPNPVFNPHHRGVENRQAAAAIKIPEAFPKGFKAAGPPAEERPAELRNGYAGMAAAKKLIAAEVSPERPGQAEASGQQRSHGVNFPAAAGTGAAETGLQRPAVSDQRRGGAAADVRRARLAALSSRGFRAVAVAAAQTDTDCQATASQYDDGRARASVASQTFWEVSTGSQTACQLEDPRPNLLNDPAEARGKTAEQAQRKLSDSENVRTANRTACADALLLPAPGSQQDAASGSVGATGMDDAHEEALGRLFEMPDLEWDWSHGKGDATVCREPGDTQWSAGRVPLDDAEAPAQLPSLDELERRIMALNQTLDAQGIVRA